MIARIVSKALPFVLALLCSAAFAQTTYTSISVSSQPGENRPIFVFGHVVNGNPGTTELIIQCDYSRSWLITDFDVYGYQASSNMFGISCISTGTNAYTLSGLPLYETLTMVNGFGQTSTLDLTINSANWQHIPWNGTTCKSKWGCTVGSAQITY